MCAQGLAGARKGAAAEGSASAVVTWRCVGSAPTPPDHPPPKRICPPAARGPHRHSPKLALARDTASSHSRATPPPPLRSTPRSHLLQQRSDRHGRRGAVGDKARAAAPQDVVADVVVLRGEWRGGGREGAAGGRVLSSWLSGRAAMRGTNVQRIGGAGGTQAAQKVSQRGAAHRCRREAGVAEVYPRAARASTERGCHAGVERGVRGPRRSCVPHGRLT